MTDIDALVRQLREALDNGRMFSFIREHHVRTLLDDLTALQGELAEAQSDLQAITEHSTAKTAAFVAMRAERDAALKELAEAQDYIKAYRAETAHTARDFGEGMETLMAERDAARTELAEVRGMLITADCMTDRYHKEREAAREALRTVLAKLPHPVWDEHKVLVWSYLDIAHVKAALGQPTEPKP